MGALIVDCLAMGVQWACGYSGYSIIRNRSKFEIDASGDRKPVEFTAAQLPAGGRPTLEKKQLPS